MASGMTPDVEAAVAEVREAFPDLQVEAEAEPQGGAYVIVYGVDFGERYVPATSWIGFLIPFTYPRADCYPHFLDAAVRRAGGAPLGEAITGPVAWHGRQALQVSRRSNRWDPAADTAAGKLHKVLDWVRSRP